VQWLAVGAGTRGNREGHFGEMFDRCIPGAGKRQTETCNDSWWKLTKVKEGHFGEMFDSCILGAGEREGLISKICDGPLWELVKEKGILVRCLVEAFTGSW